MFTNNSLEFLNGLLYYYIGRGKVTVDKFNNALNTLVKIFDSKVDYERNHNLIINKKKMNVSKLILKITSSDLKNYLLTKEDLEELKNDFKESDYLYYEDEDLKNYNSVIIDVN